MWSTHPFGCNYVYLQVAAGGCLLFNGIQKLQQTNFKQIKLHYINIRKYPVHCNICCSVLLTHCRKINSEIIEDEQFWKGFKYWQFCFQSLISQPPDTLLSWIWRQCWTEPRRGSSSSTRSCCQGLPSPPASTDLTQQHPHRGEQIFQEILWIFFSFC